MSGWWDVRSSLDWCREDHPGIVPYRVGDKWQACVPEGDGERVITRDTPEEVMDAVAAITALTPDPGSELLTRHQAALLCHDTSAAVKRWADRGQLPEYRDEDGHPQYRRADVEAFLRARAAAR